MAGTAKVKIDLDSESVEIASDRTLSLAEKQKLLLKELLKTEEGTKEFNILNNALNDTKDAMERVKVKSQDIYGSLSLLPGPIGGISSSVNQAVDAFKIFGGFKTSDLKAQFKNLGGDIKDVGATIGKLTGFTKIYDTTNRILANGFVATEKATKTASTGMKVFSGALAATGIGLAVVALGALIGNFDKIKEVILNAIPGLKSFADFMGGIINSITDFIGVTSEADRNIEKFNKAQDRTAENLEAEIALLEAQGASAKQIHDKKVQLINVELDKLRNALKEKGSLTEEEAKQFREFKNQIAVENAKFDKQEADAAAAKQKDADEKAKQAAEKRKQERDKELDELKKGNEEALKETKTARQNETDAVNQKYDKLIELAKKYKQDTTNLENGRRIALGKIDEKYNKEDQDKLVKAQEERLEKIKTYLDKEAELRERKRADSSVKADQALRKQLFQGLITQEEFDQKSLQNGLDFAKKKEENDKKTYEQTKAGLTVARAFGLISQDQYNKQLQENQDSYDVKKIENENAVTDASLAIEESAFVKKKDIAQATTEALQAEKDAQIALEMAYLDAVGAAGNILKMFAGENKNLQKAAIIVSQGAAIGQILVNASSSIAGQVAAGARNAAILGGPILNPVGFAANAAATAKGIIATKIGAGIGIANAIAGAIKGIADIDKAGSEGKKENTEKPKTQGSKFAKGGLLVGPSHNEGGIKSPYGELEGGEFVINRRSTQSFMPLLNAINSAGNRKYADGGMMPSINDLQELMNVPTQPVIKTYVVANDVSSAMEAEHKIAQMARL